MKKKQTALEEQRTIAYRYYDLLTSIVRDLESLDELIPRESSRSPLVVKDMSQNARYIIVARKDDLLGYIQTICRDHIEFGRQLLMDGWEPKHKGKFKSFGPKK